MTNHNDGDREDLDRIVHDAVASVDDSVPPRDLSLRMRLLLVLAALIVVANTVVSVYNSLALREEVDCNHQLQQALNVVGDQNRNITKGIIDFALAPNHTFRDLISARRRYDKAFAANTKTRESLLQTTCNDGGGTSPPTVDPSK